MAMSDADWTNIYKGFAWDAIKGDQISSQAIADFLVDWYFNSGAYASGLPYNKISFGVQGVLNENFGYNLSTDGAIGPRTVAAINAVDPAQLLSALQDSRAAYYNEIVAINPAQSANIDGWMNRVNAIYDTVTAYINQAANTAISNPGATSAVLFFCSVLELLR
jgi:lysozyme family protein